MPTPSTDVPTRMQRAFTYAPVQALRSSLAFEAPPSSLDEDVALAPADVGLRVAQRSVGSTRAEARRRRVRRDATPWSAAEPALPL